MAQHPHQAVISTPIRSVRDIMEVEITVTGKIVKLRIESDTVASGDLQFNVFKNGSTIYAAPEDRPTVEFGETSVEQTSLDVSVTQNDRVKISAVSVPAFSSLGPKVYATIWVEDGLPTAYGGTSATSIAIGTGVKTFTTQQGLGYTIGARVRASDSGNPTTKWMEGVVTAYSGTILEITVDLVLGSGSVSAWNFNLAGQVGPEGDAGPTGMTGADGEGVPTGGSTGQVLKKSSGTDFDTEWADESGGGGGSLPVGGTTGQVLTKQSGADGDADWEDPPAGGEATELDGDVIGTVETSKVIRLRNRGVSVALEPPSEPFPFADDFDDNTINLELWEVGLSPGFPTGGGIAETGGQLEITLGGSGTTSDVLRSAMSMNFTDKQIEVSIVDFLDDPSTISEGAAIRVSESSDMGNKYAEFRHEQSSYFIGIKNASGGGGTDNTTVSYSAVERIRIKHRSSDNRWLFYTYNSGVWTLVFTTVSPATWNPTSVRIEIIGYEYHGTPSGHKFIIDDVVTDVDIVTGTDNMLKWHQIKWSTIGNAFVLNLEQAASITTGSIGAGATALVAITWDTPFPDTDYMIFPSVYGAQGLKVLSIEDFDENGCDIRVENTSGGSLTGTLMAYGVQNLT